MSNPDAGGAEPCSRPYSRSTISTQIQAGAMSRKKILLVDDSVTTRMWQKMILRHEPVDVVEATEGEEGVRTALSERPDLILMDVVMPKMNGFEACRRLRSVKATRSTPIIMVTTRSEEENIETGYASGCSDYITKPIDREEFMSKVKNFLGSWEAE